MALRPFIFLLCLTARVAFAAPDAPRVSVDGRAAIAASVKKMVYAPIGEAKAERASVAAALLGAASSEEKAALEEMGHLLAAWEPLHRPDAMNGANGATTSEGLRHLRFRTLVAFRTLPRLLPDDASTWSSIASYIYRSPEEFDIQLGGARTPVLNPESFRREGRALYADALRRFPADRKLHERAAQICEWDGRPPAECLALLEHCRGLATCDVKYAARRLAYESPRCAASDVRPSFALYAAKRGAGARVQLGDARYALESSPLVTAADLVSVNEASTAVTINGGLNDELPERYERYLALALEPAAQAKLTAAYARLAAAADGYLVTMDGQRPVGAMRPDGTLDATPGVAFWLFETPMNVVCAKITRTPLP